MITLKGPRAVEAGATVCITASNVGAGFSALADSSGAKVKLKITIDTNKHTATICFVAPPKGQTVSISASNAASRDATSHSLATM